jgi:hypothetical protein
LPFGTFILNGDGQCSQGEIDCRTMFAVERGSNGRYEFQDITDPASRDLVVDISNVPAGWKHG